MVHKTESQNLRIYKKLRQGHIVTPQDALKLCGCFRLSARIADLKEIGVIIENRAPIGQFAQYKMAGFETWTDAETVLRRLKGGVA